MIGEGRVRFGAGNCLSFIHVLLPIDMSNYLLNTENIKISHALSFRELTVYCWDNYTGLYDLLGTYQTGSVCSFGIQYSVSF